MDIRMLYCTAATLRAVLCYIDPVGGPRIAADDDQLADELVEKVKTAVGERHGSVSVSLTFSGEAEMKISDQFDKVVAKIRQIFADIHTP